MCVFNQTARTQVKAKSVDENSEDGGLSQAARRILESLEQMSTPISGRCPHSYTVMCVCMRERKYIFTVYFDHCVLYVLAFYSARKRNVPQQLVSMYRQ